jgi:hypothetical protein
VVGSLDRNEGQCERTTEKWRELDLRGDKWREKGERAQRGRKSKEVKIYRTRQMTISIPISDIGHDKVRHDGDSYSRLCHIMALIHLSLLRQRLEHTKQKEGTAH